MVLKGIDPAVLFVGINGSDLAYTRVRCYSFSRLLMNCGIPSDIFTLQEAYHPGTHQNYMLELPKAERVRITARAFARLWRKKGTVFYVQKSHYHAAAPFLLSRLGRNRFILDYDDWDLDRSHYFNIPALDKCVFGASHAEGITANLARSASACVASTKPLRDLLAKYNDSVYLIPTVADTEKFKPVPRSVGPTTFIWNGMIWGEIIFKNVMFLAECFKSVHEAVKDVRFIIAGKGHWHENVREEINSRYGSLPIVFEGWVPPDEMPRLLGQADIGLMPLIPDRENETWMRCKCPTKLFEFMAMGIPAVVSDFGEPARVIDSGTDGLVAADRDDFVRAMITLARGKDMRGRMGKAALRKAVSRYSLASQRERLCEVITSVL